MNMLSLKSQRGSALFMILFGVALFAALSYALSQGRNSVNGLSVEKIRLISTDIIDMGNTLKESTARLRLRQVANTDISFQNGTVAGYINPGCSVDSCKVFAYDGGGIDWETPTNDVNGGVDWGFTGDVAIKNIGADDADLVALLPRLPEAVCNRINVLLNLYGEGGSPTVIAAVPADKFIGTYSATPTILTDSIIDGKTSGCIRITGPSGTAFSSSTAGMYVYYHVLLSR